MWHLFTQQTVIELCSYVDVYTRYAYPILMLKSVQRCFVSVSVVHCVL